jgi:hypothetical protein
VITLLAQGLNQDAIAAIIGVSTRKSVENYLRDAIFKLSSGGGIVPLLPGSFRVLFLSRIRFIR